MSSLLDPVEDIIESAEDAINDRYKIGNMFVPSTFTFFKPSSYINDDKFTIQAKYQGLNDIITQHHIDKQIRDCKYFKRTDIRDKITNKLVPLNNTGNQIQRDTLYMIADLLSIISSTQSKELEKFIGSNITTQTMLDKYCEKTKIKNIVAREIKDQIFEGDDNIDIYCNIDKIYEEFNADFAFVFEVVIKTDKVGITLIYRSRF